MRKKLFFLFLVTSTIGFSQKNYSKEFSLLSDNDLYTSVTRDKYYTNGLFLSYRFLKPSNSIKREKTIIEYQLGHMMYTPLKYRIASPKAHDRPFAGFLFAKYGVSRFYKNQNVFKTAIQIGVIGPSAKGKELQSFIHNILGIIKPKGWDQQIKDAIAINFTGDYLKFLAADNTNHFDISSFNTLRVGTIFTDISTGFYSRLGFKSLQKLSNSVGFHSNLNTSTGKTTTKKESFLYIKPMFTYVIYDATIEGSFLNDGSPLTFDVMPLKFSFEAGFRYTTNRFTYGYTILFHTKKLKSVLAKKNNFYGSIHINYLFN